MATPARGAPAPAARGPSFPEWLSRPGAWFWAAMLAGAALRLYLVLGTEGTYDAGIWQDLARKVRELGLIGEYRADYKANHPPLMLTAARLLLDLAEATGVPFRIWLRAPFALLDAGTALLLLALFPQRPLRFAAAAGYWLHPLALIFSAYHGNTDSAVAFCLLLCLWLLSKERTVWAGVALGASFWIKVPGLLALPALALSLPAWRQRGRFLLAAALCAVATYLPALLADPGAVLANVFGYRGQPIQTTAGYLVWGKSALVHSLLSPLPEPWRETLGGVFGPLLRHGWRIGLALILLYSWLRRQRRAPAEVAGTLAGVYAILYGFSEQWSFQYFAWSVPLWFFLGPWFLIPATLLAGGYIYSLYWLLCGNPWLLGKWDFIGHPLWPWGVRALKNLAVLFFFASSLALLAAAIRGRFPGRHGPEQDFGAPENRGRSRRKARRHKSRT